MEYLVFYYFFYPKIKEVIKNMGRNNNIQFNLTSREIILNGLKEGLTAKQIGILTNHHGSSVSREVHLHRTVVVISDKSGSICTNCQFNTTCSRTRVCGSLLCRGNCKLCKEAKSCSRYKKINCNIENKWPFVCHKDCPYKKSCGLTKYEYLPAKADSECIKVRSQSRAGLNMTEKEFKKLDECVYQNNKNGQSIYHICKVQDNVIRSKSSIYDYIHKQYLRTSLLDLPKAVTYKVRKKINKDYEYDENKNYNRDKHKYYDWLIYRNLHRVVLYWEMDFLGCPKSSNQEILTLACPSLEFLLMFVFDRPIDKSQIIALFNSLEERLGNDLFSKIFEVIITDRDSRFNIIRELEFNDDGIKRCNLFFCNPSESNEKPLVENENSQIRTIFPKGEVIKNLSQEKLDLIVSNFNCRTLLSLEDHTASQAFGDVFGEEALKKLNIKIIDPRDIIIKKFSAY